METHEQKFVFLQNQWHIHPKIDIFWYFGKILAKLIQYRNKNIHDNVHSDAIRNCFTKKRSRKSIFTAKYAKKLGFLPLLW